MELNLIILTKYSPTNGRTSTPKWEITDKSKNKNTKEMTTLSQQMERDYGNQRKALEKDKR